MLAEAVAKSNHDDGWDSKVFLTKSNTSCQNSRTMDQDGSLTNDNQVDSLLKQINEGVPEDIDLYTN